MPNYKAEPRYNIVSVRLTDDELKLLDSLCGKVSRTKFLREHFKAHLFQSLYGGGLDKDLHS